MTRTSAELLIRTLCMLLSIPHSDTIPLVLCFVSVIRENFPTCISWGQLIYPHSGSRLNFIIHWWKRTSWCLFHTHVEETASNGPCGRQESAQCVLPMLELIISLEQFHFLSWLCHFTRVSVKADCSESLSICWSSHWTYFHDLMHTHPVLPHCSNGKMQVTEWGHVTLKGLWEPGNVIALHSWLANPGVGMEKDSI